MKKSTSWSGDRDGHVGAGTGGESAQGAAGAGERGRVQFAQSCAFCHGPNANGGTHGPSLIRSTVVRHDENGNLIGAVIRDGRPEQGMPAVQLSASQVADIVTFIKSRVSAADIRSANRSPGASSDKLLTGNAQAGKAFFDARGVCHLPLGHRRSRGDFPQVFRRGVAGAFSLSAAAAHRRDRDRFQRQTVHGRPAEPDELRRGDSGCRRLVSLLAGRARSSSK